MAQPPGHGRGWLLACAVGILLVVATALGVPLPVAYVAAGAAVLSGIALHRPTRVGPWLLLGAGLLALDPGRIVQCSVGQGFLFGRPMRGEVLLARMAGDRAVSLSPVATGSDAAA